MAADPGEFYLNPDPTFERKKRILRATKYPRSSDPFYIASYYMKCVTTSWTYSKFDFRLNFVYFCKECFAVH